MVISISRKIYERALGQDEQAKATINALIYIFSMVNLGYHTLILEGNTSLKDLRKSPSFTSFAELLTKIEENSFAHEGKLFKVIVRITDVSLLDISKLSNPQITSERKKIIVEENGFRFEYIDFEEAIDFLRNDLQIFLENNTSDGVFLQQIYQLVTGKTLNKDYLKTCGGVGETAKVLQLISRPRRVISIVDSDKDFPGHENATLKELKSICTEKGIILKIWNKRMIENYLPDKLIEEWMLAHLGHSNHPYFQMTPEQKSCFNLKKGLKCRDAKKTQINTLYSNLLQSINLGNHNESDVIIEGISDKLASIFSNLCQKCTKEDFGEDYAEFQQIAEWIDWYSDSKHLKY